MREAGAKARAGRCDVGNATEWAALAAGAWLELPPLGGLWHAAGVLADSLLENQGAESLRLSCGPKAFGALNMHRSCAAAPLRASVSFSSIAALLGECCLAECLGTGTDDGADGADGGRPAKRAARQRHGPGGKPRRRGPGPGPGPGEPRRRSHYITRKIP